MRVGLEWVKLPGRLLKLTRFATLKLHVVLVNAFVQLD